MALCTYLLNSLPQPGVPPPLPPQSSFPPEGGKRGPGVPAGTASLNLSSDPAEAFREICPAGHGYTYSSSDIRLSVRKAEEEELARPLREHRQQGPEERQPLRAATDTWLEAGTIPDKGTWAAGDACGLTLPLGFWHLKEPLVVYPGSMASHKKGSLERQHPGLGTCSLGLA